MKLLPFLFLIFATLVLSAQDIRNFTAADNRALSIPDKETCSSAGIANFIQNNFTGNTDKLRAIYKWITFNIRYSKDSMYFSNWGGDPEVKIASTLRKRRGVCENYAALFTNIALKCGIPAIVVSGYTNINGSVNMTGHSWCAVKPGGEWFLCDPTWDAGFAVDAKYFLVQPTDFIATHMPFDPLWQLIPYPISHNEFRKGFASSKKPDTAVNVAAAVTAYLSLDTLQRLETSARRIKEAGLDNDALKTWHAYNKMKVNIVYQEQDGALYNQAVEELNKAKHGYNKLIVYINEGSLTAKPPGEISGLFGSIEASIVNSRKTASKIGLIVENYQYDTGELNDTLDKLSAKVNQQKKYYAASIEALKIASTKK